MNGKRPKKYKLRQCSIPEEYIRELAEVLTERYMSYTEVINFIKERCKKRYEIENILGVLDARGYMTAQEMRHNLYGYKNYYTIMTKEKYEKIEEEHRENAKRRLLAAVSC